MSDDFYPFVGSGDATPTNTHLTGKSEDVSSSDDFTKIESEGVSRQGIRSARVTVYDDLLSTPRVVVIEQHDVRTYLEDVTNTVYRTMKEQGGRLSLMIIRELVENFIHAHFKEPIISILDDGNTIRFSDQGPGINDKELAFEFGVTSAKREHKRYIRGTGSGLPMIQQYLENSGGAIAIEDNLGTGTVVTVSIDPYRVQEIEQSVSRGAAVRSGSGKHNSGQGAINPGSSSGYPHQIDRHPLDYSIPSPHTASYQPSMSGFPPHTSHPSTHQPQNPYQIGYPQFSNQFSTIPQAYGQAAEMQGFPAPARQYAPPPQSPYISDRGLVALRFISENGSGGPTDLTRAHGSSNGTWSRELATLSKAGLVHKPGQKYVLTDMGRTWMHQHDQ